MESTAAFLSGCPHAIEKILATWLEETQTERGGVGWAWLVRKNNDIRLRIKWHREKNMYLFYSESRAGGWGMMTTNPMQFRKESLALPAAQLRAPAELSLINPNRCKKHVTWLKLVMWMSAFPNTNNPWEEALCAAISSHFPASQVLVINEPK